MQRESFSPHGRAEVLTFPYPSLFQPHISQKEGADSMPHCGHRIRSSSSPLSLSELRIEYVGADDEEERELGLWPLMSSMERDRNDHTWFASVEILQI